MASRRINVSFSLKTIIYAFFGFLFVITIIIFMSSERETPVKVRKDDKKNTDDKDLDLHPKPSTKSSESKSNNKPDENSVKNNNNENISEKPPEELSDQDKIKKYKKEEALWIKIRQLIEEKKIDNIKEMLKLDPELITLPIFEGKYIIHSACKEGYTDLVTELINLGCNFKIPVADGSEKQPIHFAAESCNTDVLKILIEKGVDIDETDINGDTPLMYAVIFDQYDSVQYLLDNGANPNILISPKETPNAPNNIDSTYPVHVKTILNTAVSMDPENDEIVKILLTKADPALTDSLGMNALHTAAFCGHFNLIDMIVDTGKVDVNAVVKGESQYSGKTAVDLAKNKGHQITLQNLTTAIDRLKRK